MSESQRPTRFELIDKDGNWHATFASARSAAIYAKKWWPDQEQDKDRTGKGWDVQAIQPKRQL